MDFPGERNERVPKDFDTGRNRIYNDFAKFQQ
jgi:hypothetical protein